MKYLTDLYYITCLHHSVSVWEKESISENELLDLKLQTKKEMTVLLKSSQGKADKTQCESCFSLPCDAVNCLNILWCIRLGPIGEGGVRWSYQLLLTSQWFTCPFCGAVWRCVICPFRLHHSNIKQAQWAKRTSTCTITQRQQTHTYITHKQKVKHTHAHVCSLHTHTHTHTHVDRISFALRESLKASEPLENLHKLTWDRHEGLLLAPSPLECCFKLYLNSFPLN